MPLTTSVETLLQEFRIAVRTLSKSKVYCATVILMLALGLGATTAVLSVLNILVLCPRAARGPNPTGGRAPEATTHPGATMCEAAQTPEPYLAGRDYTTNALRG